MRLYLTIAAGVAALGLLLVVYHSVKDSGRQEAITEIENQDRSAADAAAKARDRRRACVDGGGMWDITTGKCVGR